MQPRSKVQHRLKQLIFRHLQKRLRANFRQGSATCRHNVPYDLDENGDTWIGRCGLVQPDGTPRGVICDGRIDLDTVAKGCPFWAPVQTKEEIRAEFEAVVRNPDLGVVASEYPDIAALRWVLSDPAEETDDLPSSEELSKVEAKDPPVPDRVWWRRGVLGRVFGTGEEGES